MLGFKAKIAVEWAIDRSIGLDHHRCKDGQMNRNGSPPQFHAELQREILFGNMCRFTQKGVQEIVRHWIAWRRQHRRCRYPELAALPHEMLAPRRHAVPRADAARRARSRRKWTFCGFSHRLCRGITTSDGVGAGHPPAMRP